MDGLELMLGKVGCCSKRKDVMGLVHHHSAVTVDVQFNEGKRE